MATQRTYNVKLTPAKIDDRGVVTFLLHDPGERKFTITARSLPEMQGHVRALIVNEFKQTAACYVTVPRGERKPPGFDAACRSIQTIRYVAQPTGLPKWIVTYHEHHDSEEWLFMCDAEDTDHAEEQCLNAYPHCVIVSVEKDTQPAAAAA